MSHLALLASLLAVDLLAAMSPGPNFVLVVAGFACANLGWCLAVVLGLAVLLELAPSLYTALKILGGAYLIYLGVALWRSKRPETIEPGRLTMRRAFMRGLLTNLTNPKSLVYFASVFTLFMGPEVPPAVKALAFGIVLFDTLYAAIERPINRLAGAVMKAFGVRLVSPD